LEEWCLYLTCPTGTSHWDKHNLSQWDRQIGTSCTCPSGTSTTGPNWDWERSKETSPCPMGQDIYPRWRPFLVPGQALYPRWSLYQFHLSQLVPQSGSTRPCKSATLFQFPSFLSGLNPATLPGMGFRTPMKKNCNWCVHDDISLKNNAKFCPHACRACCCAHPCCCCCFCVAFCCCCWICHRCFGAILHIWGA